MYIIRALPKCILALSVLAGIALVFLDYEEMTTGWTSMTSTLTFSKPKNELRGSTSSTTSDVKAANYEGAWPSLSSLVSNNNISGDVDFLMDFAIVAHPKCATTALNRWIGSHPEVAVRPGEDHSLRNGQPQELVKHLYELETGNNDIKRGYKAPQDLYTPDALSSIQRYWPSARLIVGVRHPISWFESWYNYNMRRDRSLPPAQELVGADLPNRVKYHHHLSYLGKVEWTTETKKYFADDTFEDFQLGRLPNKVFLYDVHEPFGEMNQDFREALSDFLGLSTTLDPIPPRESPGGNYHYAIDICDDTYNHLRSELVEVGRQAAEWIRLYFLPNEDVYSSDDFESLLDTWSQDPCDKEKASYATKDESDPSTAVAIVDESSVPNWPPLSSLVDGDEIIGDVSHLLDFAIIGHSKCSTTTMMHWLYQHPETQMYDQEVHELQNDRPAELVRRLYDLPAGYNYKRGYKAPNDIRRSRVLNYYHEYWPETRLIVGLRHPVLWFMSHYNYKISGGFQKPPPEQMVGDELPDQIRYHVHLSLLGKTSMDDAERELLGPTLSNYDYVHPLPNKVMLYDISQLSDPTDGRDLIFRRDLSDFIGFDHPLDGPPPQYTSRPGTEGWVPMDICEDKYIDLRGELMENAVNASTWIKEYFLDHPDVFVSSREHFKEILDSWLVDPCDKTRTKEIVDTSTSASIIKEAPIEASTIAVVANTSSVQIETDAIQHWGEDRPPLSSLIKNGKIIADVQPLLDFAIIGNPKTATSTLMRWISKSDEVQMYNREIRSLKNNNPAEMVEVLYSLPAGSQYIRGFKDPRTSCIDYGLKHLATYWPKTKLIIGIRHPVKWFESWYNFKERQGYEKEPAETMVGRDLPDQVRFHIHLSMLGKTARDKEEMKLLTGVDGFGSDIGGWESLYAWSRWRDIPVPVPNKVFLFEVSQPFDKDERRRDLFRKDIGDYIGLTKPLEPLKVAASSKNLHYAIDICDQKFADLRVELMRISVSASTWIRKYFMNLPDVVVSSPDRFEEILMTWLEDPCEAQR